jgi:hypothetical protein
LTSAASFISFGSVNPAAVNSTSSKISLTPLNDDHLSGLWAVRASEFNTLNSGGETTSEFEVSKEADVAYFDLMLPLILVKNSIYTSYIA